MSDELALLLLLLMFISVVWGTKILARKLLRVHPQYAGILTISVFNGIVAGMVAVWATAMTFFDRRGTFSEYAQCIIGYGVVCSTMLGIPTVLFFSSLKQWINDKDEISFEDTAAGIDLSIIFGISGGLTGFAGTYYAYKTLDSNLPLEFLCISNVLVGVALAATIAIGVIRLSGNKKKKKRTA
jgi:hypothetical protein